MTLRDLVEMGRQAANQAWYDTRNAYYQGKRKLSDLIYDAQGTANRVGDVVRESQKGYDFLSENAPKARENIERMTRDLKAGPAKSKPAAKRK